MFAGINQVKRVGMRVMMFETQAMQLSSLEISSGIPGHEFKMNMTTYETEALTTTLFEIMWYLCIHDQWQH